MSLNSEFARLKTELGELQDQQGGEWTRAQAEEYRERGPEAFGTEILGSTYWTRQVDILEAAQRDRQVAVRSANSMGKNFTGADLIAWWVFCVGGSVLYMANADRQLNVGVKELRRALRGSGLPYELFHRVLRVNGEDRVYFVTSNTADNVRGLHDSIALLVVIDEGQGQAVEAVAYDAAFSCATGEGDRILVLGNPAHPGGRFHQISKQANWTALKIAASEHPNISEGRVVIPGGPAPDWPQRIAAEYGRDSPFYSAFVEAEFPSDSIDQLIERQWIIDAMRPERADELEKELTERTPLRLILDVARYGGDACVLGNMRGPIVIAFREWRGKSLMESADILQREYKHLRRTRPGLPVTLIVDEAGLGAGVVDALREWRVPVTPFNGAHTPTGRHRNRVANQRANSFWAVREGLRLGKLALPNDPLLLEELAALTYALNSAGKIQVVAKDELRKILGRSTDRADVVAMGAVGEFCASKVSTFSRYQMLGF